jgi:hypothetical protein
VKQNFQEEIPLKLKSLVVVTLLVLGCSFASAQTFGFASVGSGLYCNYEQLVNNGGGVYSGVDNELSVCGLGYATIAGLNASTPNLGLPAHGAGVVYGDSVYALEGDPFAMWTVYTKLKCNKFSAKKGVFTGAYSWVGVASFSGVFAGDNYGYLSCSIPSKANGDAIMHGSTIGKIPAHKR